MVGVGPTGPLLERGIDMDMDGGTVPTPQRGEVDDVVTLRLMELLGRPPPPPAPPSSPPNGAVKAFIVRGGRITVPGGGASRLGTTVTGGLEDPWW
jgi:hypothetical protein